MKRKFYSLLAMMLALLLGLSGCIQPEEPTNEPGNGDNIEIKEELHVYQNTVYVYSTAVNESLLTTDLSPAYLILANKVSALGSDYIPADLAIIDDSLLTPGDRGNGLKLDQIALQALAAMMNEMAADGVPDIAITSAYRSYSYQNSLFEKYRDLEMSTITNDARTFFGDEYIYNHYTSLGKKGLSYDDAVQVVLSYSAAPGTSEHQTGLCVDFVTEEHGDRLDLSFETTRAFEWLQDNAYKFGFILRYPKEKVAVTGYSYEPWHYRFVGREAATDIYFSNMALEEYLGALN